MNSDQRNDILTEWHDNGGLGDDPLKIYLKREVPDVEAWAVLKGTPFRLGLLLGSRLTLVSVDDDKVKADSHHVSEEAKVSFQQGDRKPRDRIGGVARHWAFDVLGVNESLEVEGWWGDDGLPDHNERFARKLADACGWTLEPIA